MKSINLKIVNNTNVELPTSLFGVVQNPNNTTNYNVSYDFDMTGEVLSNNFDFDYFEISNPSVIITHYFTGINPTLSGYVEALNSLNIGFFTYNNNIIYMFSNNYAGKTLKV